MGLLNRQPRDPDEAFRKARRREHEQAESDQRHEERQQHKYAAKALKRTAKTIGLQNLRPLSVPVDELLEGVSAVPKPESILEAVEGDLLVDGQEVKVSLLGYATIHHSEGALGGDYQYREAFVWAIAGKELLGRSKTVSTSNWFSPTDDHYHPPFSYALHTLDHGQADFLAGLHAKLQEQLTPMPPPSWSGWDETPTPELSQLEATAGSPAPESREQSHEL
jgi:hypothetical protein